MRNSTLTLLATMVISCAFAQRGDNYIKLSKNITNVQHNISEFNKIDISEDFKVYVDFADSKEEVIINANENLHELIKVEQVGQTLKISTKSYSYNNMWSGANEVLEVYITAKHLVEIRAEEDVTIGLENKLVTDELIIDLKEDCTLYGEIEVRKLVVNLDEDSVLDIEGSASKMKVKAVEDCIIKGYNFNVGTIDAKLIEDSEVKLTVNGDINLYAKEDSYFHYRGTGTLKKKILIDDSEVHAH